MEFQVEIYPNYPLVCRKMLIIIYCVSSDDTTKMRSPHINQKTVSAEQRSFPDNGNVLICEKTRINNTNSINQSNKIGVYQDC